MPAPDLSKPKPKARSSTAKGKKDASGLGRALINRRAKEHKRIYEEALHTTELPSGLNSVTQENDLDEFLNTAQLAATDFSAERQNIRVLNSSSVVAQQNPYLLTEEEEKEVRAKHSDNRTRLRVPRRPAWTRNTEKTDLERRERDEFLEWRKGLADMEDREDLILTPFERNLAVWRQLWRTLERSHLIVQIVDARNPLGFRCVDLETYVKEVGMGNDSELQCGAGRRKNLLLVNKADLLTDDQRSQWADYFDTLGISYAFFSALEAVELQEEEALLEEQLEALQEEDEESDDDDDDDDNGEGDSEEDDGSELEGEGERRDRQAEVSNATPDAPDVVEEAKVEEQAQALADDLAKTATIIDAHAPATSSATPFDRTQVLTVEQLEELFISSAPDLEEFALPDKPPPKFCVGLVGYPNVGKSSTINALVGQKKVSVSSTPGKTKNFQTIHLSPEIVLCDCPGLVFPQFASTKAAMVCDGVLPIDQMREYTAPVDLVTRRIPKQVLEGIYGIRIPMLPINEGGTGVPTASELLSTYAVARGFFTQGQGNPDESRAARYVLKDYVNAKLLYCHPPPGIDTNAFNEESRDLVKLALGNKLRTKRAPTTRVGKKADTFIPLPQDGSDVEDYDETGPAGTAAADTNFDGTPSLASFGTGMTMGRARQSARADALERNFFFDNQVNPRAFVNGTKANMHGQGARNALYPNRQAVGDDGKKLSSRKIRELENLGAIAPSGKKHFKGNKRQKKRSGAGYE